MVKHPLVIIEWEDHYSEDKWQPMEEAIKPEERDHGIVRSVGWLISEDANEYRIVANFSPKDAQVSMRMVILKGTVKSFKVLRKNG
jgi:hypothetical protein